MIEFYFLMCNFQNPFVQIKNDRAVAVDTIVTFSR